MLSTTLVELCKHRKINSILRSDSPHEMKTNQIDSFKRSLLQEISPARALVMMGTVTLRVFPMLSQSIPYKYWCKHLNETKNFSSDLLRLHAEMKPYLEVEFLENFDKYHSTERALASICPNYKNDILKSEFFHKLIGNVDYLPFGVSISAVREKPGITNEFDFPIAYVNVMYTRITGYNREDVIGKDFMFMNMESVIELELITRLKNGLNRAEQVSVILTTFTPKKVAYRHLFILRPLLDYDGCYAYVLALHFDITMMDSVNAIGKMAVELMKELPQRYVDL